MKIVLKRRTLSIVISITLLVILVSIFHTRQGMFAQIRTRKILREPAVAGQFYPIDGLDEMVANFLKEARESEVPPVRGLVVPHAGYIFSGLVAAQGYKQIDEGIKRVIILGPSHHIHFFGASVPDVTHYRTPLGEVKISERVGALLKERLFVSNRNAHTKEHSIEVQLPMLQKKLGNFELIPIVTGNVDPQKLAKLLIEHIDEDTLVVASSDLSHYYPYDVAKQLDKMCIESISKLDFSAMRDCQACGKIPILSLMYIARELGWAGTLLEYRNSGDVMGDKARVVGYASIAFYEGAVSAEEERLLLSLARRALENYLERGKRIEMEEEGLSKNLLKRYGCFVTLEKHGQLRGCIGHVMPQEALYECVIDNAINAAVNDRRFEPLTYDELDEIEIEISILSVPKPLEYSSSEELLSLLRPFRDGVFIKAGQRQATFLPQVWEDLPDKKLFLSRLCLKAGLPTNCWRSPHVTVETYRAHIFSEI